jgi:monovalent cation/proton antiporter MnhG/PhaG subunit
MILLEIIKNTVGCLLLGSGAIVVVLAAIGSNRLRDFFERVHACAVIDALGVMLFMAGAAVLSGFSAQAIKLLVMLLLFLFVGSTSASLVAHLGMRTEKITGQNNDKGK